jgi:hypothetical protein
MFLLPRLAPVDPSIASHGYPVAFDFDFRAVDDFDFRALDLDLAFDFDFAFDFLALDLVRSLVFFALARRGVFLLLVARFFLPSLVRVALLRLFILFLAFFAFLAFFTFFVVFAVASLAAPSLAPAVPELAAIKSDASPMTIIFWTVLILTSLLYFLVET